MGYCRCVNPPSLSGFEHPHQSIDPVDGCAHRQERDSGAVARDERGGRAVRLDEGNRGVGPEVRRERPQELRDGLSSAHGYAGRSAHAVAVGVADDVLGEKSFQPLQIALLCRSHKRFSSRFCCAESTGALRSRRDVPTHAGDQLPCIILLDLQHIADLGVWIVEGLAQHIGGTLCRERAFRAASASPTRALRHARRRGRDRHWCRRVRESTDRCRFRAAPAPTAAH